MVETERTDDGAANQWKQEEGGKANQEKSREKPCKDRISFSLTRSIIYKNMITHT